MSREPDSPRRKKSPWHGFISHALAFVGVISILSIQGDFPVWSLWWGLGLAFHGLATLRKAKALSGTPELAPTSEENRGATPQQHAPPDVREAAPAAPVRRSELVDAVLSALAELERSWSGQDGVGDPPDFAGLSDIARAMDERLQALRELIERGEDLPGQVAAAQARLDGAESQVEAETYERELEALQDRLSSHQAALTVVRMLEAELRTLLHRVEGLRLDIEHRAVDRPNLDTRAEAIREQLQAASEVDEHLARARRAARAKNRGS